MITPIIKKFLTYHYIPNAGKIKLILFKNYQIFLFIVNNQQNLFHKSDFFLT